MLIIPSLIPTLMMFFVFCIKLAKVLRELLELFMAHSSIRIPVLIHHHIDIIFRWRWMIHHHKKVTNCQVQLLMAQISASISIKPIKRRISVFLKMMFSNM